MVGVMLLLPLSFCESLSHVYKNTTQVISQAVKVVTNMNHKIWIIRCAITKARNQTRGVSKICFLPSSPKGRGLSGCMIES